MSLKIQRLCELKKRIDALESVSTPPTPQTCVSVDTSYLFGAALTGNGNASNIPLTITAPIRSDEGWTFNSATNAFRYTGNADSVEIGANVYYNQPQSSAYQRIAPSLQLQKRDASGGSAWLVVERTATGYQRHASGHDSSSNAIVFTDYSPFASTEYRVIAQRESAQTDVLMVDIGHVTAKAIEKVDVVFCEPEPVIDDGVVVIDDDDPVIVDPVPYGFYTIRSFTKEGYYDGDKMNGQLQVFNTNASPGAEDWQIRFRANFDIQTFVPTPSSYVVSEINQVKDGSRYNYEISVTGVIGAYNQNVQFAITGVRNPDSNDAVARHRDEEIYAWI